MNYSIRRSTASDKLKIQKAHRESIRQICSADYTEEEIKAWSNVTYTDDVFLNNIKNDCHLCIELDDHIEGVCHARFHGDGLGEIMGLYLSSKTVGKGIGRVVFEKALDFLKNEGASKIQITGTRTAKGFYEKMGFKAIGPEKLFDIRGAKIACYEMEMLIHKDI